MIGNHGNAIVLRRTISLTLTQNCPGKPDHFSQQAVGAGVEWGCPVAYPRKAGQSLCPVGKEWGSSGAYFLPDDCHIPFFEQYCAIQHPYFSKPDIYAR
jgi:hypothetical protein